LNGGGSCYIHEALFDLNNSVEQWVASRMECDIKDECDNCLVIEALEKCEAILDWCWETINCGKWSEVAVGTRKVYGYHRLLKAMLILIESRQSPSQVATVDRLVEALDSIDYGLIMSPDLNGHLMAKIASLIHQNIASL